MRPRDWIRCPRCTLPHRLRNWGNGRIGPLLYYRCGKKSYVGAVNGACVHDVKPWHGPKEKKKR